MKVQDPRQWTVSRAMMRASSTGMTLCNTLRYIRASTVPSVVTGTFHAIPRVKETKTLSEKEGSVNDLTIYDTLAESWWQAGSKLHMLARMNPARFAYFDPIVGHWQGRRVLDLGCGGGLTTTCLAQRGATVVGVDLSRASLHVASRHARGHGCLESVFACSRVEFLPFADASFDIVWCTDVLEHLSDLPVAIAQIARVLKPGGSSCTIRSIAPGCPAHSSSGFGNTSLA